MRRLRVAAVAAIAVSMLSGCASTVTGTGHAAPPASSTSQPPSAQPPSEKPSTKPPSTKPPSTKPSSAEPSAKPTSTSPTPTAAPPKPPARNLAPIAPPAVSGAIVESHRMGPYVTDLHTVFPNGQSNCFPSYGPWPTAQTAAVEVFTEAFVANNNTAQQEALAHAGYAGGFAKCASAKGDPNSQGTVMLMETHDEARARAMVGNLQITLGALSEQRVSVPGFPDAVTYQGKSHGQYFEDTLLVTGRMVTYVWMEDKTSATVTSHTAAALAAQKPYTATFIPTDYDRLGLLDDDPHGIAAKTLHPPGKPTWFAGGYTVDEWSAISSAPERETPALKRAGAEEIYYRDGTGETVTGTYQVSVTVTPDPSKAAGLLGDEIDLTKATTAGAKQVKLPGHPGVTCLTSTDRSSSSSYPEQQCMFAAKQYFVFLSVYNGTASAGDLAPIGKMVAKQLKLTPP